MKHTLFLAIFALSLGAFRFSQAQNTPDKNAAYQEYLKRSIPVLEEDSARIVTTTSRQQYKGGEDIVLSISLKNIGVKAFGAREGDDDMDFFYDIEVKGPNEVTIPFLPSHNRRRNHSGPPGWTVGPSRSRNGSVWLNNLFALDYVGKYQVVVSKKFRRGDVITTVASEPLTFEVTSERRIVQWD